MRCSLFVKIVTDCEAASDYFKRHWYAAGIMGFNGYQKISASMRVLAYVIPTDYTDEYLHIGEDTTMALIHWFSTLVIRLYGDEYLRAPNEDDAKRLMEMNEKR
ncbi:Indole-3-glycerol phosphate lyase, chloroplastic [Hordeum vulgare]|nr:Indole-3-glycerol phosphate lyase, chloroplastic [Hordeum vulgare]